MRVLALNGSPHKDGNTYFSLNSMREIFELEGIDFEIWNLGKNAIRDCVACRKCNGNGCVFDDNDVNKFTEYAEKCDGFVFGTPVYYAHPTGQVLSFLDRAFYSRKGAFEGKVGAGLAVARRAGTCASFDVMNKYFGISNMIVAGSSYWNIAFGQKDNQVQEDKEGIQTVHNLAKNMAWIMKCIDVADKAGIKRPVYEAGNWMNFIR